MPPHFTFMLLYSSLFVVLPIFVSPGCTFSVMLFCSVASAGGVMIIMLIMLSMILSIMYIFLFIFVNVLCCYLSF